MVNDITEKLYPESKELKQYGGCIRCKKYALDNCYSEAGLKEYRISGLCELCFDKLYRQKGEPK